MPSPSVCSCPSRAEKECIKQFDLTIYPDIAQVEETKWNQLIPEANRLMYYDQLRMLQTTHSRELEFRYVFIQRAGATVGVAYFQMVPFNTERLMNYFPDEPAAGGKKVLYRLAKAISEPLIRSISLKLLVSGNVFMTGENGFYFQHDIDKPTRGLLIRKAIDEVAHGDKKIRAVLVGDLYEPQTEFDIPLISNNYHKIVEESDMSLKLNENWNAFYDYLEALSSKYRVRARKAIALCAENGVVQKNLSADEILLHEHRLNELYRKIMSRADFKLAELDKDFFYQQKKLLPGNYFIYAYFKDEQIIGFISCYVLNKRMEVHYTGMDAEICKPLHLYQHMLYDMVNVGIANKVNRLHFGCTAPEIKSTIGAAPSAMYGYVKHFNPLFNFVLVRTFTTRLKPQDYTIRNPFK